MVPHLGQVIPFLVGINPAICNRSCFGKSNELNNVPYPHVQHVIIVSIQTLRLRKSEFRKAAAINGGCCMLPIQVRFAEDDPVSGIFE